MRFSTLDDWLAWQETLHPQEIELGLERVSQVFRRLHDQPAPFVVITVAGTNGKGSSVALLEAILLRAGYRTGTYTSPHLLRYNERIRLDGRTVDDTSLCQAFQRIDVARGTVSLSYFEFGTLAALDIFYHTLPEVILLEVGMGGRLDAVNIMDPDVALITSISRDHMDWLGQDREAIAREKAGIMRHGIPVICSDPEPPAAIAHQAAAIGACLYQLQQDFHYHSTDPVWTWCTRHQQRHDLPLPALRGEHQLQNAAGVLMALEVLAGRLPVSQQHIRQGLLAVQAPGRFQVIYGEGDVTTIIDVAHNPASAAVLARQLEMWDKRGRIHAVVSILNDKDLYGMFAPLADCFDTWYLAETGAARSATAERLVEVLQPLTALPVQCCASVAAAYTEARRHAASGDTIVIWGSFYTVAEALPHIL